MATLLHASLQTHSPFLASNGVQREHEISVVAHWAAADVVAVAYVRYGSLQTHSPFLASNGVQRAHEVGVVAHWVAADVVAVAVGRVCNLWANRSAKRLKATAQVYKLKVFHICGQ